MQYRLNTHPLRIAKKMLEYCMSDIHVIQGGQCSGRDATQLPPSEVPRQVKQEKHLD